MRSSLKSRIKVRAFTLLEICLVMAIAVMVVLMAVPSLSGLIEGRDEEERYEQFQNLVFQIREESLRTQRVFQIDFTEDGAIGLEGYGEDPVEVERFELDEGESLSVEFPAAMVTPWAQVWDFWPNGMCEPAIVTFKGKNGKGWKAVFDPFTGRAEVTYESNL